MFDFSALNIFTAFIFLIAGIAGSTLGFGFAGVCALVVGLLGARDGFPLVSVMVLVHVLAMVKLHGRSLSAPSTYFAKGPRAFIAGGLLGAPLGMALLFALPADALKCGLGFFVGATALFFAVNPHRHGPEGADMLEPKRSAAVGFLGGLAGGFASFPLAPLIAYFKFNNATRSTMWITQPFALACQVAVLALLALHDPSLFSAKLVGQMALCLPATLIGTAIGVKPFKLLSHAQHSSFAAVILGFSAIALFVQPGAKGPTAEPAKIAQARSAQAQGAPGVGAQGLAVGRSLQ